MGSGAEFPSENISTQDGVNLKEGDSFSAFASEICRQSYKNSPFVRVHDHSRGHFRGPRTFTLRKLPRRVHFDLAGDGIGTKTIVIDAAYAHPDSGRNLVAMCFEDIDRWGGMALVLVNVLDVATLGETGSLVNNCYRSMLAELGQTAKDFGFVLYKGETAELGACVGSENPGAVCKFNWTGVAFGVYDPERMITGNDLRAGQVLVALREYGLRSNGYSSARAALRAKFGPEWYSDPTAKNAIQALARPATLYHRFLEDLNGWYHRDRIPVQLIVHVTGGAIRSKLGEDILFPRGLSANLNDLWEPPEIMRQCAQWRGRGMEDKACYETWNGGQGELLVVDDDDKVLEELSLRAKAYGIEAKVCGRITKSANPHIKITSKFTGKKITFP